MLKGPLPKGIFFLVFTLRVEMEKSKILTTLLEVGFHTDEYIVEDVVDVGVVGIEEVLRFLHIVCLCKCTKNPLFDTFLVFHCT